MLEKFWTLFQVTIMVGVGLYSLKILTIENFAISRTNVRVQPIPGVKSQKKVTEKLLPKKKRLQILYYTNVSLIRYQPKATDFVSLFRLQKVQITTAKP